MRPITIVGGGLAGLSLGIALSRRNIPVTLFEAGNFPRHKVCGEFMAGLEKGTLHQLGIAEYLSDAHTLCQTAWFFRDRLGRVDTIPRPALALSRYTLDHRLAQAFRRLGGKLCTQKRIQNLDAVEGQVWAAGRRARHTSWIGLKMHCFDFPLESDLEVHLGRCAYAGASPVEGGRVNICGLFRKRPEIQAKREQMLPAYLEACGMLSLARRMVASHTDPSSVCGIAAINFARSHQSTEKLYLGDQYTVIPPFTGNGMSMAFEAAALAVEPLVAFARAEESWTTVVKIINFQIRRRFRIRLGVARALHPLFYRPACQQALVVLNRIRVLPFQTLFRMLH